MSINIVTHGRISVRWRLRSQTHLSASLLDLDLDLAAPVPDTLVAEAQGTGFPKFQNILFDTKCRSKPSLEGRTGPKPVAVGPIFGSKSNFLAVSARLFARSEGDAAIFIWALTQVRERPTPTASYNKCTGTSASTSKPLCRTLKHSFAPITINTLNNTSIKA